MNADALTGIASVCLASGRVSYSIAKEEIFRPYRELVWRYSAPEVATDTLHRPWRMLHWYKTNEHERSLGQNRIEYDFDPQMIREPGFFGQLVECPYCLSFWVTFFTLGVYSVFSEAVLFLALWCLSSLVVRMMP